MRQVIILKSFIQRITCNARGLHVEAGVTGSVNWPLFPANTSLNPSKYQLIACHTTAQKTWVPLQSTYVHSEKIYNCVSGLPIEKIDIANRNKTYECPKIGNISFNIETPAMIKKIIPLDTPAARQTVIEPPGTAIGKFAETNVRRRRRSMKKHQRKRMRKRNWCRTKKVSFQKDRKRKKALMAYQEKYRQKAEGFDAMAYIERNLQVAKDHGYHVNILTNQSLFGDSPVTSSEGKKKQQKTQQQKTQQQKNQQQKTQQKTRS